MFANLLLALLGCGATPASITLEPNQPVAVHALQDLPLPAATVLDANGAAIEGTQVTWSVEPAEIAKLSEDGKSVTLLAEGEATVTAAVGELKQAFAISIGLPDAIEIANPGRPLVVGEEMALTAQVTDRGNPIADQAIAFESSDPAVLEVAGATVRALAEGTATLTAKSGELSATLELTIGAAAPEVTEGAPEGADAQPL